MRIEWYDGVAYTGKTAKEIIFKMAHDSPFEHQGPLWLYTLKVARRCWILGDPVRPFGYETFLKDLFTFNIIKKLEGLK